MRTLSHKIVYQTDVIFVYSYYKPTVRMWYFKGNSTSLYADFLQENSPRHRGTSPKPLETVVFQTENEQ